MRAEVQTKSSDILTTDWRARIKTAMSEPEALDTRSIFHELNPHLERTPILKKNYDSPRYAAILFPIIDREEGPSVLLTVRSNDMPSHAGQIGFPGGRVHETDRDRVETALRETEEEVGIARRHVDVIGDMGVHFGGMGFAVTPVLGLVHPGADISPCPREVQTLFEVPFSYLLDMENHVIEERESNGVKYRMPAIPYKDYHIWGLTAGIINTLVRAMNK